DQTQGLEQGLGCPVGQHDDIPAQGSHEQGDKDGQQGGGRNEGALPARAPGQIEGDGIGDDQGEQGRPEANLQGVGDQAQEVRVGEKLLVVLQGEGGQVKGYPIVLEKTQPQHVD